MFYKCLKQFQKENNTQFSLMSLHTETLHITGNSTSKATTFPTGILAPGVTSVPATWRGEGKQFYLPEFKPATRVWHFLLLGDESQFQSMIFGFLLNSKTLVQMCPRIKVLCSISAQNIPTCPSMLLIIFAAIMKDTWKTILAAWDKRWTQVPDSQGL